MTFEGFPRDLPAFLADLEADNDRDWYKANRARYEAALLDPAKSFVSAIGPELQKINPAYNAEPRINRSISRLERDTRFSADKRPYSPRLHLVFWRGPDKKAWQGLHFVIHADNLGIGAGLWQFNPAQLKAFRSAIADLAKVAELDRVLAAIEKAGGGVQDEPPLKRPTVDGNERTQWHSRFKGMVVRTSLSLDNKLFGPEAVRYAISRLKIYEPLMTWLDANVMVPANT